MIQKPVKPNNDYFLVTHDIDALSRVKTDSALAYAIEYKGYIGSVGFSEMDALFFGKVTGIRALISYEGGDAQDLIESFHRAVDDYLEMCAAKDIEPEKCF